MADRYDVGPADDPSVTHLGGETLEVAKKTAATWTREREDETLAVWLVETGQPVCLYYEGHEYRRVDG